MFRDPKEMADFMKSLTPQFKTNKNGYEIRTKILEMAKDQMAMEYSFQFQCQVFQALQKSSKRLKSFMVSWKVKTKAIKQKSDNSA